MADAKAKPKTTVFLSYSRKDGEFTQRLANALELRGYAPIFDESDRSHEDPDLRLTAQDEWWRGLKAMIAASDVMVFIVTPDSAASAVCDDEIAHAKNIGKRVISILRRPIDFNAAPERLRALNVKIDFLDEAPAGFDASLNALVVELDVDIEWHRRGARLMRQAQQWEADGRPEGQLLRAGAIVEAETWAIGRSREAPDPGPLLMAFFDASREKERSDRDELRRAIGRAFVKPARQALEVGRYDMALRLAAAGTVLGDDLSMSLVPERETEGKFRRAAFEDKTRAVLSGHRGRVVGIAFSASGDRIVSYSGDRTARVWALSTGEEIDCLHLHQGALLAAAFTPQPRAVSTTEDDNVVWVWDVEKRQEAAAMRGHTDAVLSAAFNTDASRVVTTSKDKTVRIWNTSDGRELSRLKTSGVSAATFSPDGAMVSTTALDEDVQFWNVPAHKLVRRVKGHEEGAAAISWSPAGERLAIVAFSLRQGPAGHIVRIVNRRTGRDIARLQGHDDQVLSAAFSPDGDRLVTTSQDGTVRMWDAASGAQIVVMRGHEGSVTSSVFSPDGSRIATASSDKTVRVWDSATSAQIGSSSAREHNFDEPPKLIVEPAPNTRGSSGVSYCVRDVSTGREIARLLGHEASVNAVAATTVGALLVTASSDHTARVWDANSGAELLVLRGYTRQVESAEFSPDGDRIVTVSLDETVRVWDTYSGAEIACFSEQRPNAATFSPNGEQIVIRCHNDRARYFDVSRTSALAGEPALVLAASLSAGKGRSPPGERADLLMQSAPDDLCDALMERLSPDQRVDVRRRAEILSRPLNANCYRSTAGS